MNLKKAIEILKHNKDFRIINLSGNQIGDEEAKALAEALKHATASHEIYLSGNQIGDEGAKALAEALKISKVSHTININSDKIGAEGAKALAEVLKVSKVSHTIDINNNEIGAEGAKALANALKISKVSHTIDIDSNEIGDEGAKALANALKISKVSHTIDIDSNEIGDEGAKALANALKGSNFSHTIDIDRNKIGDEGIKDLQQLVDTDKYPPNIMSLDINISKNWALDFLHKKHEDLVKNLFKVFDAVFNNRLYYCPNKKLDALPMLCLFNVTKKKNIFDEQRPEMLKIIYEFLGSNECALRNIDYIKSLGVKDNTWASIKTFIPRALASVRNDGYWYEDLEINTILSSRIEDYNTTHQERPINHLQAIGLYVNAIANESSIGSIANGIAELLAGSVAVVVPLNINHNHWISAIIQRNENNEYNITITDSLNNVDDATYNQIHNLFSASFGELGITTDNILFTFYTNSMQQNDQSSCGAYAIENAIRFLGGAYAEVDIRDFHHQLYLRDLPERNSTVCDKIKNKAKDFAAGKKKIDPNDYRKFYDCLDGDCQSEVILEIKGVNQTTTVATCYEYPSIFELYGGINDPALSFIE